MSKIFLDTDIFITALDSHNKQDQQQARFFLKREIEKNIPVISVQVLQEYYCACVSRFGIDKVITKSMLKNMNYMEIIDSTEILNNEAIDISMSTNLKFWDCLIIAAAKQSKCSTIYSLRLPNNMIIQGIKVINPFSMSKKTPTPISLF